MIASLVALVIFNIAITIFNIYFACKNVQNAISNRDCYLRLKQREEANNMTWHDAISVFAQK